MWTLSSPVFQLKTGRKLKLRFWHSPPLKPFSPSDSGCKRHSWVCLWRWIFPFCLPFSLFFFYIDSECVCVCVYVHMSKDTWRTQFFPSPTWVLEMALRSTSLGAWCLIFQSKRSLPGGGGGGMAAHWAIPPAWKTSLTLKNPITLQIEKKMRQNNGERKKRGTRCLCLSCLWTKSLTFIINVLCS